MTFLNKHREIYKHLICTERNLYYIFKIQFSIDYYELFFIDRYLGFDINKGGYYKLNSDQFTSFLINHNIATKVIVDKNQFIKEIKNRINNNNIMTANIKLRYPDKANPYEYVTNIIIEGIEDNNLILTKLSNIEEKVCYKESYNKFLERLYTIDDHTELIVYENNDIFKEIYTYKSKDKKLKYIMLNLYGLTAKGLNKDMYTYNHGRSTILKILDKHQHNVNEYILSGVKRKEYSSFSKRIRQMIYPSLICMQSLSNSMSITEKQKVIMIIKNINKYLDNADKFILLFFHTLNKEYFIKYRDNIEKLSKQFKIYQKFIHNYILEII